ncbi:MAG: 2-oxoacid:acceptor oxidoreductase subunit alpha [Erysipelotrichaceae bacterium]|nr:2-oxoacid:acceptor oxidoreductase subunit alpha [Erysipelotrichaceae bacterium]
MDNYKIITGNEACARAAIASGMRFFAGYPITPATEIAELCSELLPQVDGTYMQMEDELASIGAVIGASAAGKKAMTATSGPGFSLMQENLGWAYINEIPCVIVDVMRKGPSGGSSTLPAQADIMQTKWGTHGDYRSLVLTPASVEEIYHETIRAFNLAEKFRQPVILLYDAVLAHMSEKVLIPDDDELGIIDRARPASKNNYNPFNYADSSVQPLGHFGEGYNIHMSGLTHDETGFPVSNQNTTGLQILIHHLFDKIDDHYDKEIKKYEAYRCEDADVLVVSIGITSRSAKNAVKQAREMGIKAGLFRPITMWPFPHEDFSRINYHSKAIVTAEMNNGQLNQVVTEDIDRNQKLVMKNLYDGNQIRDIDILNSIIEANKYEKR